MMPEVKITALEHGRMCPHHNTTVRIRLYNSGSVTGMGTVKLYLDNELKGSEFVEVQPSQALTIGFKISVERPGLYTLRGEFSGMGLTSTKTEVVAVQDDSDCDGWTDYVEEQYGTDPHNPDMDGDGVPDSLDVDPFKNVKVTVYVFRAKVLDDFKRSLKLEINVNGVKKAFDLSRDKNNVERKPFVGSDLGDPEGFTLRDYLESYAIAKVTVDVPDDEASVPIRFHLHTYIYTVYSNGLRPVVRDIDISPGKGTVATIVYNLKTGTWSGDDFPGDEEEYFGYGHLSGCGDGSCGIGSKEPDKDLKVYAKYESILKKKGIRGKILNITTIPAVKEVRIKDGKAMLSISQPEDVKIATVRLENGSIVNVTLVNTYNAKVLKIKPIKPPAEPDVPLTRENTTTAEPLKGEVEIIPLEGDLIGPEPGQVVTYSSELDGELWFVVTTNDRDFIPFYREVELNNELLGMGLRPAFNPKLDTQLDRDGDYDGDGVPNAVELLIGKDPGKRDILGIELNISVEWRMRDEDEEKLVYSIRKASDFIYDYTDGYAMITRVTIWDDKRNWDKADVRVHDTTWQIPQTPGELLYPGWPKAIIGGYWMKRDSGVSLQEKTFIHIMMPEKFWGGDFWGSIGEEDWGETLGHELGHYVFWLGDEYLDWHGHKYGEWYPAVLTEFVGPETPEIYLILAGKMLSLHTVMNKQWKWSELSTPRDYEMFRNWTHQLWQKYPIAWISAGYTTDADMLPDQWGNITKNPVTDYPIWHCSAWEALFKSLTGHEKPKWVKIPNSVNLCMDLDHDEICDRTFPQEYKPKTGPYTGVGYFMEVIWG